MTDIPNASAIPTAASRAPIHIGVVGIVAKNIDRLTGYYRDVLGLTVFEQSQQTSVLGVSDVALLELIHRPDARPDDTREAGLYHIAFLMPTRADLARWILHTANGRVPITGASDHDVSEAIYLDDPEGNGVEVYSDRPSEQWRRNGKEIFQKTDTLDIELIIREVDPASAVYVGAPEGLRIGHIHLRVGNTFEAEQFYSGALGLEVTRRRTGATFMSSGGYHHHVGANVWHSHGAALRSGQRTGLGWFSLEVEDQLTLDGIRKRLGAAGIPTVPSAGGIAANDPWGTQIRFTLSKRDKTSENQSAA